MSDEQAGPAKALPHLARYEENFYHCSTCNYCVDMTWDEWGIDGVCPTLRHYSPALGYSGKGYIAAARAWYEGAPPDLASVAERAFTCTTCGNCEEVCPIGMRPQHIAVALRSEIIARGLEPKWVAERLSRFQAENAATPDVAETRGPPEDIVLLCSANQPQSLAEGSAAAALLGAAGTVRLVETQLHDLAELSALGYSAQVSAPLTALRKRLADMGAARVAAVDADGLSLLLASDGDPKIESTLSVILASLRSGALVLTPRSDNPPPARVGYLDACHLTKKAHGTASLHLAEAARDLLGALGIGVIGSSSAAAQFQMCCGAAGGMPAAKPDAAREMANARLVDFEKQDAQTIVTASPLCSAHLAGAGNERVKVQGLYAFLMSHFEARSGSARP